jgi:hypothetical protein
MHEIPPLINLIVAEPTQTFAPFIALSLLSAKFLFKGTPL